LRGSSSGGGGGGGAANVATGAGAGEGWRPSRAENTTGAGASWRTELRAFLTALRASGEPLAGRRDQRGDESVPLRGIACEVVARHLQPLVVHPFVVDAAPWCAEQLVALLLAEAVELGIIALERERERDDVRGDADALAAHLLHLHHRVDELLRLDILGGGWPP
jgi:hypothetical protein